VKVPKSAESECIEILETFNKRPTSQYFKTKAYGLVLSIRGPSSFMTDWVHYFNAQKAWVRTERLEINRTSYRLANLVQAAVNVMTFVYGLTLYLTCSVTTP